VVGFGLLVFVLLLFADKTNLSEDEADEIDSGTENGASSARPEQESAPDAEELLDLLTPFTPDDNLKVLLTALEQEKDKDARSDLLREIVEGAQNAGRVDVAAVYAGILADEQPDPKNQLVAGALYRNANRTPAMLQDTVAFRKFSDRSIDLLEKAVEAEPDNEDAKIELGLAFVEARVPGLSMQGILKIREVAEANPQNTEALFHLGGFSLETGQFDKAEGRFRQILEVEPGNIRAKYFLGVSLREQGKSAEYIKWMTEVAEQQQDPELAAAAESSLKNTQ
jgi:tetratricopeptide (TPR) repeat protein